MKLKVGELFILGFRGSKIPNWLVEFEKEYSLGGVILFDYNVQTKSYDNNIQSKEQLKELCNEISKLPSKPFIMVDQEGGKVRRLKEKYGFSPLPSQEEMTKLPMEDKLIILDKAYSEMKSVGINFNLAPVIDLNYNKENPDIGKIGRSYSQKPSDVIDNFELVNDIAARNKIALCLKHYPGLGGATVNSHDELTDLTGTITDEQLNLFYSLSKKIYGGSILISHGLVRDWDPINPASMSQPILKTLRTKMESTLLISDDLQMKGLQEFYNSENAALTSMKAGMDMVIYGNNLMPDDEKLMTAAKLVTEESETNKEFFNHLCFALARVKLRKSMLGL